MNMLTLHDLLCADSRDIGCDEAMRILDQYVELELAGGRAAARFPGTAAHLNACEACHDDHAGLLGFLIRQR
jgi:hypothetical protein